MNRRIALGPSRLFLTLALLAVGGGMLSGCARPRGEGPETTGSIGLQPESRNVGSAAEWTERYKAAPNDPNVALNFALALRAEGRPAQAVEVLQKTMVQFPGEPTIASAYGKALAEKGDFDEALKVLRSANSPRTPDWRLTSAEGAVHDQMGNTAEARRLYEAALKIVPDEPTVLNNLGLSYTLTNELPKAEATLRRAVASPRADSRVRQNLGLIIDLQGRFDEAARVVSQELPPQQAEANVAYLRTMLTQPNTWKQIEKTDRAARRG